MLKSRFHRCRFFVKFNKDESSIGAVNLNFKKIKKQKKTEKIIDEKVNYREAIAPKIYQNHFAMHEFLMT